MATGQLNPQLGPGGSNLETLIASTLRRIGEYDPDSSDGDTFLLFQEYANRVIDDINKHPYFRGEFIDYYVSDSEKRPIHDNIVITGMIYYYAMSQGDEKTPALMRDYRDTLSGELWYRLNGNTKVNMIIFDGGSNPRNQRGEVNRLNGIRYDLPANDEDDGS